MSVLQTSSSQIYRLVRPAFLTDNLAARRHSATANHLAKFIPKARPTDRPPPDTNVITPATLARYIRTPSQLRYNQLTIIDCRYAFEFNSGRIVGALNVSTEQQMESLLQQFQTPKTLFVFYSQDSKERALTVCTMFRKALEAKVPDCTFAVLQGGMKDFYASYSFLCLGHYKPKICLSDSMLELVRARKRYRSGFKATKKPGPMRSGKIQFVLNFSNAK